MKKILTLIILVNLILFMSACGLMSHSSSLPETHSESSEEKSRYSEGSCAYLAQDGKDHKISITIENSTGGDMKGLYVCKAGEKEWKNLFDHDEYLTKGKVAENYLDLIYNLDSLRFDLGIRDQDNNVHEFNALDLSNLSADGFTITFSRTDDNSYYWTVDKKYLK